MDDIRHIEGKNMGESYLTIKKFVEDVESAVLTVENYKQWKDRMKNTRTMIDTQTESHDMEYKEYSDIYNKKINDESISQYITNEVVPRDIFDSLAKGNKHLKNYFSWVYVERRILRSLNKKLFDLVEASDGMKVKQEVLKETKEMSKQIFDFFRQEINTKFETFKHENDRFKSRVDDQMLDVRKYQVDFFKEAVIKLAQYQNQVVSSLPLNTEIKENLNKLIAEFKIIQEQQEVIKELNETKEKSSYGKSIERIQDTDYTNNSAFKPKVPLQKIELDPYEQLIQKELNSRDKEEEDIFEQSLQYDKQKSSFPRKTIPSKKMSDEEKHSEIVELKRNLYKKDDNNFNVIDDLSEAL